MFRRWLPLGISIIGLSLLAFVLVQQSARQGFYEPQAQLVEDAVNVLAKGGSPAQVVPRTAVFDLSQSLASFIAVYDKDGTPLESSGQIDNAPPKPPAGVFAYALAHGEDRVTWQPNSSVRIALIVKPVPGNLGRFVASGRNMRELEGRAQHLLELTLLGMAAVLVGSFVTQKLFSF